MQARRFGVGWYVPRETSRGLFFVLIPAKRIGDFRKTDCHFSPSSQPFSPEEKGALSLSRWEGGRRPGEGKGGCRSEASFICFARL